MDTLRTNYEQCVRDHHRRSDHHLEHFQFTLEARMLVTCHLLGRALARGRECHRNLTLEECLSYAEQQSWEGWQFALLDQLPKDRTSDVSLPEESLPKTFDIQEYHRLLDPHFSWIHELECVKHYILQQMTLKFAVQDIHHRITTQYDPRFSLISERIQNYHLDQLKPDIIRANTLYYYRDYFVTEPSATKEETEGDEPSATKEETEESEPSATKEETEESEPSATKEETEGSKPSVTKEETEGSEPSS